MRHFVSFLLLGAAAAAPALAQEGPYTVIAGGGIQSIPDHVGATSDTVAPLFILRYFRPGDLIPATAPDQSPGITLFGDDQTLAIGPVIGFQTGREREDVGLPVDDVDLTVEPGFFIQSYVGDSVRLRGELRRGINGHDAFVGDLMADYVLRDDANRSVATIGPRVRFGDDRFARKYFSLTPGQAAGTGFAPYDADGGLYAVGVAASALYRVTEKWSVYGYGGYDRLLGDAEDSPIVDPFGSADQFSAGIGVAYTFDVNL